MGLVEDALARQAAQPAPRRIDYDRMNKVLPHQKAELTRARKAAQAAVDAFRDNPTDENDRRRVDAIEGLATKIKKHVAIWNDIGAWPDQWHLWQIALDDVLPLWSHVDINEL